VSAHVNPARPFDYGAGGPARFEVIGPEPQRDGSTDYVVWAEVKRGPEERISSRARHITAALNACHGLSTEQLEAGAIVYVRTAPSEVPE
jgi:hypothetical protein